MIWSKQNDEGFAWGRCLTPCIKHKKEQNWKHTSGCSHRYCGRHDPSVRLWTTDLQNRWLFGIHSLVCFVLNRCVSLSDHLDSEKQRGPLQIRCCPHQANLLAILSLVQPLSQDSLCQKSPRITVCFRPTESGQARQAKVAVARSLSHSYPY